MEFLDYLKKASSYSAASPDDFSSRTNVAILTDFTDDILEKLFIGATLSHDVYPTVHKVPYRQYHFELKDSTSALYASNPDITFMFFGTNPFKDSELSVSREHFQELLHDIERYAKNAKGTVAVNSFIASYHGKFSELIREYNVALQELASRIGNIVVLDTNRLVHKLGEARVFDLRGLYAFDIPFTHEFMMALAESWTAYVRTSLGKIKKCIVLDLDNTLWGGVVGELGPTGVALGPDYPGNAFVNFQRALLDLHERGILLAIASKNNPEDVKEIFQKNPYMVLKENNFSAMRVNWGDKAESIRDIAHELNIGVDSMVFLDDDPLMRTMVRDRLPGISVPEFSIPPEEYAKTLYELDLFHQLPLTEEDSKRGKMYAEESERKKVLSAVKSIDDYIAELNISIRVSVNDEGLIPRISQLTLKTNQFNLTTHRHIEHDVRSMIADGALVFSGHVSDKFGDYGTVIVAIVKDFALETFLMSCRVMGRGVECVFMDHVIRVLHERGDRTLRASFIPTAKNKPAENFLGEHGFVKKGAEEYSLDIAGYIDKPCSKVNKAITIIP